MKKTKYLLFLLFFTLAACAAKIPVEDYNASPSLLNDSTLTFETLTGLEIRDTVVEGASFRSTRINGFTVENATLSGFIFDNVTITDPVFKNVLIKDTKFINTSLNSSQMENVSFDNVSFEYKKPVCREIRRGRMMYPGFYEVRCW